MTLCSASLRVQTYRAGGELGRKRVAALDDHVARGGHVLRALPTRPFPTMIAGPTSEAAIARGGPRRGERAGAGAIGRASGRIA